MQVQCRAAVHYLKLFFLGAFERKELGLNLTQHSASKPADAQTKLAQWLQQKFDAFLTQLHSLLQSQQSAELQVSYLHNAVCYLSSLALGIAEHAERPATYFVCISHARSRSTLPKAAL